MKTGRVSGAGRRERPGKDPHPQRPGCLAGGGTPGESPAGIRRRLFDLVEEAAERPAALEELAAGIDAICRQNDDLFARLQALEAEHPTAFDALTQQVFQYDRNGVIVKANLAARQALGDGIVGMDMHRLVQHAAMRRPDGRPVGKKELPVYRALQGETVTDLRLDITDCRGKTMNLLVSATPLVTGAVVTWQDVTALETAGKEQRHLLRRMREANADLLELSADLDRERQNLTEILSALPDLVTIIDGDGRLAYANPPAARAFGCEPDEIAGLAWQEIGLPAGVMKPYMETIRSIFVSGRQATGEIHPADLDGGHCYEFIASPLFGSDGRVTAVLSAFRDISDRKRMEEAMRESEEKYRLLFERMLEAVYLFEIVRDGDGNPVDYRCLDLNRQAEAAVGQPVPGLIGTSISAVFGEVKEPWEKFLSGVAASGEPGHAELSSPSLGQYLDVAAYCPQPDQIAVIANDISRRRRAEEALKASEEMFRTIAQRSFDIIATFDTRGRITYISPAVERSLGYRPEELEGATVQEYVLPSSLPELRRAHRAILGGEEIEGLEIEIRRRDGGIAVLENNASLIFSNGETVGIQCTARDITERVLLDGLKQQAYDRIEHNIEQFAILGDHIRHPLQVILARADLMDDPETAENIREQVRRINAQIRQLDEGWVESRKIREFLRRNE
ncbi:MAG: PAS domain S-box protein [Methanomicrobiaceae archaeon]|nr:PAS domain S-box protein [Methanomicrobiaceae archaeon]MDD5419002.1 PAS domain S-box protein [Methanomicrobiaceae archaeon]